MDDSKKKPLMIAIIIVCLGVAGAVTYMRAGGGGGTINDIPADKMTWVKCNNPQCEATYQMAERDYHKAIQAAMDPRSLATPPLTCEKCGKASVYKAFKCPYCGDVFFAGAVKNDFADRCPKCNKSQTEEIRKARKAGGQ
jgi:hypothetical protein